MRPRLHFSPSAVHSPRHGAPPLPAPSSSKPAYQTLLRRDPPPALKTPTLPFRSSGTFQSRCGRRFAASMSVIWKTMAGLCGVGIVTLFLMKEVPMVKHTDETYDCARVPVRTHYTFCRGLSAPRRQLSLAS
ncbi:hypothetical protein FKP32DRAFT_1185697 [Trametes sanguinea]|nr:hypothetical protein FKP32DRAFT_1185697 [Trametes sanguinea]